MATNIRAIIFGSMICLAGSLACGTDATVNWVAPVMLSNGSGQSYKIASSPGGTFLLVWTQTNPIHFQTDTYARRLTNGGATIGPIVTLHTNQGEGGSDAYPAVGTDGSGNWVVVFSSSNNPNAPTSAQGSHLWVTRSSDDGQSWTPATSIRAVDAAAKRQESGPVIRTNGAGRWVLGFAFNEDIYPQPPYGFDTDLFCMTSTNAGIAWSSPVPINTDALTDNFGDSALSLTAVGDGTIVANWREANLGNVYESRGSSDGATWLARQQLNDVGHYISGNGAGTWLAAGWTYNQILLNRSTNQGNTWTPSQVITTGVEQIFGTGIAGGIDGSWIAVWSRDTPEESNGVDDATDIHYSVSIDDGTTWTEHAPVNTNWNTDTGYDVLPIVATDGFRNCVVVWNVQWVGLHMTRGILPRATTAEDWHLYQ